MRYLLWFIRLVVFVLVVLFAVENTEPVQIKFYGAQYTPTMPLVVALLVAFCIGMLFSWFFGLGRRFKKSREVAALHSDNQRLKHAVRSLEEEIEMIRHMRNGSSVTPSTSTAVTPTTH